MKRRWTLRQAALSGLVGAAVWLSPSPAAEAHPFGDPQTAEISATADGMRLVWNATPDDLAVLAAWIGVTSGAGSIAVFEDGVFAPEESTELPGLQLARAPQLSDYLLERIDVTAAGESCPGEVLPVDDVAATGVRIDFDCGGPVSSADVRIATLTDIDEAYRTLASGPFGQGHAYTSDTGTVAWALTTPGAEGGGGAGTAARATNARSAAVQLGGVGVGVAVLAGVGTVVLRRRRTPAGDGSD